MMIFFFVTQVISYNRSCTESQGSSGAEKAGGLKNVKGTDGRRFEGELHELIVNLITMIIIMKMSIIIIIIIIIIMIIIIIIMIIIIIIIIMIFIVITIIIIT